jgi:hypothetical protein
MERPRQRWSQYSEQVKALTPCTLYLIVILVVQNREQIQAIVLTALYLGMYHPSELINVKLSYILPKAKPTWPQLCSAGFATLGLTMSAIRLLHM